MRTGQALITLALVLSGFSAGSPAAPSAGQRDDFQDATSQGWTNGPNFPAPTLVSTDGPAGAGDAFLHVQAGGSNPPRLIVFSQQLRWTGDYLGSEIGAITMDLRNLGQQPLMMRVALIDAAVNGFASTTGFTLPNDGQWHQALFSLHVDDLTAIGFNVQYSTIMSAVNQLRILHSASPDVRGDFIEGGFGVDNITAVAIPEPATAALLPLLATMLLRRRAVAVRAR